MTTNNDAPKPRGFAAMSEEKRREIARRGGAAVRPENRSFSKDRSLAASAGSIGGKAFRKSDGGDAK